MTPKQLSTVYDSGQKFFIFSPPQPNRTNAIFSFAINNHISN